MLESVISLASYGLNTGGTAGNFLFQLEQQGVFSYVLPFLVIFAILYGILDKIKIFGENKGINIVLSVSVALMSLQMNFVSYFFREIFPRMGILTGILLVLILMVGIFFDFEKKGTKTFFGVILLIGVLVIVLQSFGASSWFIGAGAGSWRFGYFFQRYATQIFTVILVGATLYLVIKKSDGKKKETKKDKPKLFAFPDDFVRDASSGK